VIEHGVIAAPAKPQRGNLDRYYNSIFLYIQRLIYIIDRKSTLIYQNSNGQVEIC